MIQGFSQLKHSKSIAQALKILKSKDANPIYSNPATKTIFSDEEQKERDAVVVQLSARRPLPGKSVPSIQFADLSNQVQETQKKLHHSFLSTSNEIGLTQSLCLPTFSKYKAEINENGDNLSKDYLTNPPTPKIHLIKTFYPTRSSATIIKTSDEPINKSELPKKQSCVSISEDEEKSSSLGPDIAIAIEDLIWVEEKLYELLSYIKDGKSGNKICLEWWSYISKRGFYEKLFAFFLHKFNFNVNIRKWQQESSILEFMSVIICSDACKDTRLFSSTVNLLKNLLCIVHQNYLIICDIIMNCLPEETISSSLGQKLITVIDTKIGKRLRKGEHFIALKGNNENILSNFKNIFRTYGMGTSNSYLISAGNKNTDLISKINQMSKNLSVVSINLLNELFKESNELNTLKTTKSKGTHLHSNTSCNLKVYLNVSNADTLSAVSFPYLTTPFNKNKRFTLVLDLDETIVYIEPPIKSSNKRGLHIRPYLIDLLEECSQYYEIVVFTASLQHYADPIINSIELQAGKKLFDYRLYRQHATKINGQFVKDLSKIGRPLSRIVIVDNMQSNFQLQKENGILIKSFEIPMDQKGEAVLEELSQILIEIAETATLDIRKALFARKDDIRKKVTCLN